MIDDPVGPPRLVAGHPRPGAGVTVAVPVYQGGEALAATLSSVLAQPDDDLEVVVLDNASTDGTAALLAAQSDPRLVVYRNPATVSMTANHNRAVALAGAPLVKLMGADDLLEPGAVGAQARILRADPTLAMVAGREHFVDADGEMLVRSRFLRGLVGTFDRLAVVRATVRAGGNPVGADVAVTFRRRAFDAAGGYDDQEMLADLDLWLRMLEHGRFHGQAATVARFRVRGGTRTAAADEADEAAHDRYLGTLLATTPGLTRADRVWSRLRAPGVRWRRRMLYALARRRTAIRPDDPVRTS